MLGLGDRCREENTSCWSLLAAWSLYENGRSLPISPTGSGRRQRRRIHQPSGVCSSPSCTSDCHVDQGTPVRLTVNIWTSDNADHFQQGTLEDGDGRLCGTACSCQPFFFACDNVNHVGLVVGLVRYGRNDPASYSYIGPDGDQTVVSWLVS